MSRFGEAAHLVSPVRTAFDINTKIKYTQLGNMFDIFCHPADLYWWSASAIVLIGVLFAFNSAMYLSSSLEGVARSLQVPPSQLMLVVAPCTQVYHNNKYLVRPEHTADVAQIWPLLLTIRPVGHDPAIAFSNVASVIVFNPLGLLGFGFGFAFHKTTSLVDRKALAVPALLAAFATVVLPLLNFSLGRALRVSSTPFMLGLLLLTTFVTVAITSGRPFVQAWRSAPVTTQPGQETVNPSNQRAMLSAGIALAIAGSLLLSFGTQALVQWNFDGQRWSPIIPVLATQAPAIATVLVLAKRGEVIALEAYALGSIIMYVMVGFGTAWTAAHGRADYEATFGPAAWASLSGNVIVLLFLANARYVRATGIVLLGVMVLLATTGDWQPPQYFVVE